MEIDKSGFIPKVKNKLGQTVFVGTESECLKFIWNSKWLDDIQK